MHTTYLVFIRNEATKEEFTAPYEGNAQTHDAVMLKAQQDYARPRFTVHTAYSVQELSDALENLFRWGTLPSRPQFQATQASSKEDAGIDMLSQLFEGQRQKTEGLIDEVTLTPPTPAKPQQAFKAPQPAPQKEEIQKATPQPVAQEAKPQPTEAKTQASQEEETPLQRLRRELESSRPTAGAINASTVKQPASFTKATKPAPIKPAMPQPAAPMPEAQKVEKKEFKEEIPPLGEESVIFRLKSWYGQTA